MGLLGTVGTIWVYSVDRTGCSAMHQLEYGTLRVSEMGNRKYLTVR